MAQYTYDSIEKLKINMWIDRIHWRQLGCVNFLFVCKKELDSITV